MIKAGSGTMKSRRLNLPALLRWLLMVFVLAGPGYAYAIVKCTDWNGNDTPVNLKLPDSVSLQPGMDDIPPVPPVTVNYKCIDPDGLDNVMHTSSIVILGDANNLIKSLKSLGLTLTLNVSDSSGVTSPSWVFNSSGAAVDNIAVGRSYNGITGTGNRTMTINAALSRDSSEKTSPGFYAIPSLSAFKLVPYYGTFSGGLQLNTPAIRIQYVPTCFVQTSLNTNNINFGPVLTTDVDSSFDRQIPFTVTASVNKNCNGGQFGNLQTGYTPALTGAKTYYLDLPLKVSFVLNNGGEVSSDRKSILLYKESTSDKNGLQLKINAHDGNPVTFNEASLPVNKFGNFQGGEGGGTWNIINSYQAVLSSTGEQVKNGKYSAQVTVKVDYY
ncbi:fimbrial protein [Salmonella enterica]|nr:fimbrial protein [Salmonella enterica]EHF6859164.1 fimbrial protein [Salmonella enterica subsp. enterica serovar Panama]